jgi:hypothetical protein
VKGHPPMRLAGLMPHGREAAQSWESAGSGPVGPDTPPQGPEHLLTQKSGKRMGGGQAGVPADGDHVPWTRPPWRGHCYLGWSRRGPAREAGPARSAGPERADARLRPERPMGGVRGGAAGGSGGAEESATQSQRQLAIDRAKVWA